MWILNTPTPNQTQKEGKRKKRGEECCGVEDSALYQIRLSRVQSKENH